MPTLRERQTQGGCTFQIFQIANFRIWLDAGDVAVRKRNLEAKATNILTLLRTDIQQFMSQRQELKLKLIRGSGQFVIFQEAIEIYQSLGLSSAAQALQDGRSSYKSYCPRGLVHDTRDESGD